MPFLCFYNYSVTLFCTWNTIYTPCKIIHKLALACSFYLIFATILLIHSAISSLNLLFFTE